MLFKNVLQITRYVSHFIENRKYGSRIFYQVLNMARPFNYRRDVSSTLTSFFFHSVTHLVLWPQREASPHRQGGSAGGLEPEGIGHCLRGCQGNRDAVCW